MLDCIEIEPVHTARASVIWLHGLGADGNDFVPIIDELGLPEDHGIRFVFPNSPVRAVTLNNGLRMRAWYDIEGTSIADEQDERGIRESTQEVAALIAREADRGVPAHRLVLAGFSQGGAIALYAGLRHPEHLAGIMALSTYLPLEETLAQEAAPANADIPVLMAHGNADPVVPISLGQASRDALVAAGYDVVWHEYPMQHQVCLPQIATLGRWLSAQLID